MSRRIAVCNDSRKSQKNDQKAYICDALKCLKIRDLQTFSGSQKCVANSVRIASYRYERDSSTSNRELSTTTQPSEQ